MLAAPPVLNSKDTDAATREKAASEE